MNAVWRLVSVWRLSVAYIGLSQEQRPRKTKIGTEVAHVTHDSDTTFKVKRSRSPGRFTHHGLNTWGRCSEWWPWKRIWHGTATLHLLDGTRGAYGGGEGQGHIVSPCAQLVIHEVIWCWAYMCLWWQYLQLVRGFKYYGYIVFKPCTSDYPQPDTKVTVATGNKELNFRIHRKVRTVKIINAPGIY